MSTIYCHILENPNWKQVGNFQMLPLSDIRVHKCFIPNHLNFIEDYHQLLTQSEKIRASRYHQQKDAQRFIIARGVLKTIVGKYLDLPASDILIETGKNKKPFIKAPGSFQLEFNMAHSGNWIVFAFSLDPVGIDVEHIVPGFQFETLLSTCFTVQEQAQIVKGPNARTVFYLLWTRKESFLKAISKGLDEDLPIIPCLDGKWELPMVVDTNQHWEVLSFMVDPDHWVSITFGSDKKNILFQEQDM